MALPPLQRYEMRLADICETLHMSHNGSGDTLSAEEEERYITHLQDRLAEWHASGRASASYDDAYKSLVVATLAERGLRQ